MARNYALEIDHFGYRFDGQPGDPEASKPGRIEIDGNGTLVKEGSVLQARDDYAERGRAVLPGFIGEELLARFRGVVEHVGWVDAHAAADGIQVPEPSRHGMLAEHVGRLLTQPDVLDLFSRILYRRLLMVPGNVVRLSGVDEPGRTGMSPPPGAVASIAIRLDRAASDGGGTAVITDLRHEPSPQPGAPWTGILAYVMER